MAYTTGTPKITDVQHDTRNRSEGGVMAMADYYLCDVCGNKAFYDANITDPRYSAIWDEREECDPIGIAAICPECNKTHKAVIVSRIDPTEAQERMR